MCHKLQQQKYHNQIKFNIWLVNLIRYFSYLCIVIVKKNYLKILIYIKKIRRRHLLREQYDELEFFYSHITRYPLYDQYEALAKNTNLSDTQLTVCDFIIKNNFNFEPNQGLMLNTRFLKFLIVCSLLISKINLFNQILNFFFLFILSLLLYKLCIIYHRM